VKSFLAEYYKAALQEGPYSTISSPESDHAECNTTTTCTTSNTTNEDHLCNTTDNKDGSGSAVHTRSTEHPNLFNSINSIDEAEKHKTMRDMATKLAVKLGSMCKEISGSIGSGRTFQLPTTVQATGSSNKEMGDLSSHLQFFVDNINESLQLLGATDLTEEELKLLLAAAPLPTMGDTLVSSDESDQPRTRPRSHSAAEVLSRCTPPANPVSRRLVHSVSAKDRLSLTSSCGDDNSPFAQADKPLNGNANGEQGGLKDDGSETPTRVFLGIQRRASVELSKEAESSDSQTDAGEQTPTRKSKRLSAFFSKKMESLSNILEGVEFTENKDKEKGENPKVFFKSKSFNVGYDKSRNGAVSPKSGSVTPRSGYTTPYSGESSPGSDVHAASLRLKVELVERALCDEVAVRVAAEQRLKELNEMILRLKTDLDRANSQNETVAVINKQMGVELRFLRQRNSRVMRDRQQWEDALVGETKKRRTLEQQMQMLIRTMKEQNMEDQQASEGNLTHKQQEAVFAQQREEVLLGVIESLREQLYASETEIDKARTEWQEERAKYQETYDLLRFQLDQRTLTRTPAQSTGKIDPEFAEKVEEVIRNSESDKSGQCTPLARSVQDLPDLRAELTSSAELKQEKAAVAERMKLFFLSSSWWPKLDFLSSSSISKQPVRPPVLLMQIAWWLTELREYVATNHLSMRFLAHSNQFCNCDDCVNHVAKYAVNC
jgi:hypothetical protein